MPIKIPLIYDSEKTNKFALILKYILYAGILIFAGFIIYVIWATLYSELGLIPTIVITIGVLLGVFWKEIKKLFKK